MIHDKRKKCPDCYECQICSENRCRLCRQGAHCKGTSELGTGFTHGQYLEWKRKKMEARTLTKNKEICL